MMRPRGQKGYFFVEALIALAIVSAVLLIVVNVYKGVSRALVQSRVQKEVAQYAQGELQRLMELSRMGDSQGHLIGYNQIIANGLNNISLDGQPHQVYYPDALMGSESASFSRARYALMRTISVNTINSGTAGEYLLATVTLADSQSPPRFSPITMTTEIRKPNPNALDTRQAVDAATLNAQLQDAATHGPINPGNGPQVGVGIPNTCTNISPGNYYCSGTGLNTQNVYTASCTAANYWGQYVSPISLGVGSNSPPNLNPVSLQPVYFGGVNVGVRNYNGGNPVPLPGATVTLYNPSSMPQIATVCNGCGVTNSSIYYPVSDNGGNAVQAIPIPYTSSTTYVGYRVDSIGESGYFTDSSHLPQYFTITYNSTVTVGPFTLYPYLYASLQVQVNDQQDNPINSAQVSIYNSYQASYDLLGNIITDGSGNNLTAQTNSSGQVTFNNVPTNTQSSLTATTRTIYVVVRRALYQREVQAVTINQGQTGSATVVLPPHALTMRTGLTASASPPWSVAVGSSLQFSQRLCYAGHDGTSYGANCGGYYYGYQNQSFGVYSSVSCQCGEEDIWDANPAGFSAMSYGWIWSPPAPGYLVDGYLSPYACSSTYGPCTNGIINYTATQLGNDQFSSTATYNFSYTGGAYGPNIGSQSISASTTVPVSVGSTVTPPALAVAIVGPGPNVLPSSNNNYTANATYGSNPLPNDIIYKWGISGSGTLGSNNAQSTAMTAGGSSSLGQTVTLNACVASAILGCSTGCNGSSGCSSCSTGCATATKTVTINYNNIVISLSPSGAQTWLPNTANNVTASVSGGSGSFSYSWVFLDNNNNSLGTSVSPTAYLTNFTSSVVTVNAETSGTLKLQVTATDTVSGLNQTANMTFTVQPPGSSN